MQYKEPPTRRYSKGQKIFVEGNEAREAFILRSGSVEVSIGEGRNRRVLDIITANQMFGEMGLIGNMPRTATVKCLEETVVTVVAREMIEDKIEEMDPYIRYLMQSLIDRLARTSQKIGKTRLQPLDLLPNREK
ncbi:Crp/Fnr family transcriptional regulator [Nisaea nitritireducens]|uniref:Crp/Fnr family transcriptional regulator n=1 Tax=Nisaea nitritireducens TaxID=568392 RepID=UPI00186843EA|nr:cyclic nucleotide-binding domain-containing protein [Nisaea nitritireducens]